MKRLRLASLIRPLLLLQIGLFAFFVAGSHGAFMAIPRPSATDFGSFYAAGTLARDGHPEAAYDQAAHRAAMERRTPGIDYAQVFFYPPVFLLLCALLAHLPYLPAFVLFEAATASVWLILATRIAGGGRQAAMALAAVPSVFWAAGWGQNSFLSASLMAAGTLLLDTRPLLGGAAFGALCFKPHFGVLIPLVLLAAGRLRAFAAAAASAAALVLLSAWALGIGPWRAFLAVALHARAAIESGRILFSGHVDAGGAMRLLGLPAEAGWAVQAAASIVAAAAAIHVARRGSSDMRNAALVAATLVAMPFLLFYDLVMASLAAAWLVREARRTGFLPGEAACLAAAMLLDLLAYPAARLLHLPLGALVGPLLLALAWRRCVVDATRAAYLR